MNILTKKEFHLTLDSRIMKAHVIVRNTIYWKSSNGNSIMLGHLDVNHLKNIIAKIDRGELEEKTHQLFDLKNELNYRTLING